MKKVSTAAVKATKNFSQPKLTIGLDLGDRSIWYCLLDEVGEVLQEQKLGTTPKAMNWSMAYSYTRREAPSFGWPSTASSSCAIAYTWNRGIWPPTPSTSSLPPCDVWLTKPPMLAC